MVTSPRLALTIRSSGPPSRCAGRRPLTSSVGRQRASQPVCARVVSQNEASVFLFCFVRFCRSPAWRFGAPAVGSAMPHTAVVGFKRCWHDFRRASCARERQASACRFGAGRCGPLRHRHAVPVFHRKLAAQPCKLRRPRSLVAPERQRYRLRQGSGSLVVCRPTIQSSGRRSVASEQAQTFVAGAAYFKR